MVMLASIGLSGVKWSRATGSQRPRRCYSLIETAKANNLEPYAYILGILNHIGCAVTFEKVVGVLAVNTAQKIKHKVWLIDGRLIGKASLNSKEAIRE